MDKYPIKWNIGFIVVALLMGLYLGHCQKKQTQVAQQQMAPVLKEDENEKVTINSSHGALSVTRISRLAGHKGNEASEGAATVSHLGTARKASITVKKDGSVEVWAQTKGFWGGYGIGLVESEKPRLSLDVEAAYCGRHGLSGGITLSRSGDPRLFVAYSYNVYSNTSLMLGVDNHKDIVAGIRIAI